MADWLEEGHLAWFVIDAVKLIDTSSFDDAHPDGPGRPAYEPEMLLGVPLYTYATGVRSSRVIMAACQSDLAFKVIAVNLVPDHRTIARFRADNEAAIKSVFVEVLEICRAAGLASLGRTRILELASILGQIIPLRFPPEEVNAAGSRSEWCARPTMARGCRARGSRRR